MNTEISRISKLLKYNWEGPMWYGGNLKTVLTGITNDKAFHKPGAGSHNIYELVTHMSCWRKFVLENLKGNEAYSVEINSEVDWLTKYEPTEATWQNALNEFERNQTELIDALTTFEDSKLDELVPGKKFSWYILIHGVLHHDIYHSAQISILKK
ncbi:MAG: hypothetical protein JWO06_3445 [Bacteroidota bacterium]|nr:hypothetical protein [Bacteroidota bacterium]